MKDAVRVTARLRQESRERMRNYFKLKQSFVFLLFVLIFYFLTADSENHVRHPVPPPPDAQNVKKVMNYSVDHPTHLPIVCDDKVLYLGS